MKLYNITEISKILNISKMAIHNWCHSGKLNFITLPNGHRRFTDIEVNRILKINPDKIKLERKTVLYSRVSTNLQKDNLDRQIERLKDYASSNGLIVGSILSDIGSGMNMNRPNFKKLINLLLTDQVENLIVEYKDRLIRFNFEIFELICSYMNTNLIVINQSDEVNHQKEITQDMIAIIHHFSMKLYGSRRSKKKIEIIKKELLS